MTDFQEPGSRIIEAIKSGDEAAFLALYRKLQAPIYRFAFQMTGSRSVAEDVTQEVFLALIHRSDGFDSSKGTLAAYLMGVARKCFLRRLKTDRPFVAENGDRDGRGLRRDAPVSGADPLSEVVREESVQLVREAVVTLPLHYREVLVLCEIEERSYREAALILGCSTGTVRSRLHRARELLARKLKTTDLRMEASEAKCVRCPA